MFRRNLVAFAVILAFCHGRVPAQSIIDIDSSHGLIAGQTTWTTGTTVNVHTDVTVTGAMTIDAGVRALFDPGARLIIEGGALDVVGTAQAPVMLGPALEAPWGGLLIQGPAIQNSHLMFVTIQSTEFAAIQIHDASPTIDHCMIDGVTAVDTNHTTGSLAQPAYGIKVLGASSPRIERTTIRSIRAGDGWIGATGADGSDGLDGDAIIDHLGIAGRSGTAGSPGDPGASGGDAVGMEIGSGASATVRNCIVRDIFGGSGGQGGLEGRGGAGGKGGTGFSSRQDAPNALPGGAGGMGGDNGGGGPGGQGGNACGIRFATQAASGTLVQNLIIRLEGRAGGLGGAATRPNAPGGTGGMGGSGGLVGGGVFIGPTPGANGGAGGKPGDKRDGGAGGLGGQAQAIALDSVGNAVLVADNTIAAMASGPGGSGGPNQTPLTYLTAPGGPGGGGYSPQPNGLPGPTSPPAKVNNSTGVPGVPGSVRGFVAVTSSSTGSTATLDNNIFSAGLQGIECRWALRPPARHGC